MILQTLNGQIIDNPKIKNLTVIWNGSNSKVILHEPVNFLGKCQFILTDDNVVEIKGTHHHIRDLDVRTMSKHSELHIGEDLSCNGCTVYYDIPNQKIHIGKDCMFAFDIIIWPDDGHAILDIHTKQVINRSNPETIIGNHVWVTRGVNIIKNTVISDNCIIGMHSIVSKPFAEKNSVIAGVPAKIVKSGITWTRKNSFEYDTSILTKRN